MREIPYTSKLAHAEDGRPLALKYYILVNGGEDGSERYGVKTVEENSGGQPLDFDLTTDLERIYELVDKLSRNSVTPAGVSDVLADWLYRKWPMNAERSYVAALRLGIQLHPDL